MADWNFQFITPSASAALVLSAAFRTFSTYLPPLVREPPARHLPTYETVPAGLQPRTYLPTPRGEIQRT